MRWIDDVWVGLHRGLGTGTRMRRRGRRQYGWARRCWRYGESKHAKRCSLSTRLAAQHDEKHDRRKPNHYFEATCSPDEHRSSGSYRFFACHSELACHLDARLLYASVAVSATAYWSCVHRTARTSGALSYSTPAPAAATRHPSTNGTSSQTLSVLHSAFAYQHCEAAMCSDWWYAS